MAHSCLHCQKLIIAQPTVYEELEGKWVDVVVLGSSFVLLAVSEGCAFFVWCLSLLSDNNNLYESQGSGNGLSLKVAMWSTDLQNTNKAKFVVVRWEDKDGEQAQGTLKILAYEG
jgi:hypothetical protein